MLQVTRARHRPGAGIDQHLVAQWSRARLVTSGPELADPIARACILASSVRPRWAASIAPKGGHRARQRCRLRIMAAPTSHVFRGGNCDNTKTRSRSIRSLKAAFVRKCVIPSARTMIVLPPESRAARCVSVSTPAAYPETIVNCSPATARAAAARRLDAGRAGGSRPAHSDGGGREQVHIADVEQDRRRGWQFGQRPRVGVREPEHQNAGAHRVQSVRRVRN